MPSHRKKAQHTLALQVVQACLLGAVPAHQPHPPPFYQALPEKEITLWSSNLCSWSQEALRMPCAPPTKGCDGLGTPEAPCLAGGWDLPGAGGGALLYVACKNTLHRPWTVPVNRMMIEMGICLDSCHKTALFGTPTMVVVVLQHIGKAHANVILLQHTIICLSTRTHK